MAVTQQAVIACARQYILNTRKRIKPFAKRRASAKVHRYCRSETCPIRAFRTTKQRIITRLTKQRVIREATSKSIPPDAASERVNTIIASEAVFARIAIQRIIANAAQKRLIQGAAEQAIIGIAAKEKFEPGQAVIAIRTAA